LRRLKPDFVGCGYGRFVEPMSQAAYYAVYLQFAIGAEHHFQKNLTFKLQLARLIGIKRLGLEDDLDRKSVGRSFLKTRR